MLENIRTKLGGLAKVAVAATLIGGPASAKSYEPGSYKEVVAINDKWVSENNKAKEIIPSEEIKYLGQFENLSKDLDAENTEISNSLAKVEEIYKDLNEIINSNEPDDIRNMQYSGNIVKLLEIYGKMNLFIEKLEEYIKFYDNFLQNPQFKKTILRKEVQKKMPAFKVILQNLKSNKDMFYRNLMDHGIDPDVPYEMLISGKRFT